jgi:hypothetical protein
MADLVVFETLGATNPLLGINDPTGKTPQTYSEQSLDLCAIDQPDLALYTPKTYAALQLAGTLPAGARQLAPRPDVNHYWKLVSISVNPHRGDGPIASYPSGMPLRGAYIYLKPFNSAFPIQGDGDVWAVSQGLQGAGVGPLDNNNGTGGWAPNGTGPADQGQTTPKTRTHVQFTGDVIVTSRETPIVSNNMFAQQSPSTTGHGDSVDYRVAFMEIPLSIVLNVAVPAQSAQANAPAQSIPVSGMIPAQTAEVNVTADIPAQEATVTANVPAQSVTVEIPAQTVPITVG